MLQRSQEDSCYKIPIHVLPKRLIGNLYGPLEGRRHDCALLNLSGLLKQLEKKNWTNENGQPYAFYGDPAYPVRDFFIAPFKGAHITEDEATFNTSMSSVRECVEWEFGKILRYFAYLDFRKNLKVLLQPVGKYYLIGALLANCHTCLYGNQTSKYFNLMPPTLENYLQ